MVSLYVFSLVLGGGFLSLAVFGDLFGGHGDADLGGGDVGGFDGDLHLDAGGIDVDVGGLDLDAGGLDLDVDVGGMDLDAGGLDLDAGHMDVDAAHAQLDADAGGVATKIFSIRTIFYSMFGFGAMGSLLTFLWGGSTLFTAAFAVLSGVCSGAVINAAFSYMNRSESGLLPSESTYAGISGRVVLPIRPEIPGKVVVERGGRSLKLRALPHPTAAGQGDPSTWKRVLVVEMEKGIARVAPIDEELLLDS